MGWRDPERKVLRFDESDWPALDRLVFGAAQTDTTRGRPTDGRLAHNQEAAGFDSRPRSQGEAARPGLKGENAALSRGRRFGSHST